MLDWTSNSKLGIIRDNVHTKMTESLLSYHAQMGVYVSRSWTLRDGLILSVTALSFHLLSILYLRLAYHKVYEGKLRDKRELLSLYK